jgi:hypothetical protein
VSTTVFEIGLIRTFTYCTQRDMLLQKPVQARSPVFRNRGLDKRLRATCSPNFLINVHGAPHELLDRDRGSKSHPGSSQTLLHLQGFQRHKASRRQQTSSKHNSIAFVAFTPSLPSQLLLPPRYPRMPVHLRDHVVDGRRFLLRVLKFLVRHLLPLVLHLLPVLKS